MRRFENHLNKRDCTPNLGGFQGLLGFFKVQSRLLRSADGVLLLYAQAVITRASNKGGQMRSTGGAIG